MKSLKTPLRYPGGKSRAIKYLLPHFPDNVTEYREPFIGGGSVAIAFTKENPDIPVWVNDLYEPLVNFWKVLQSNGIALATHLEEVKKSNDSPDLAKKLFDASKEIMNDETAEPLYRAACFYILNKCSFSGLTESSSFSRQASISNFSLRGIDKLPQYSELIANWKITNLSYEEMLDDSGCFIFLDPPYNIKDNLYGSKGSLHKGFDHKLFCDRITECNSPWMITYNSHPTIKEWYENYEQWTWDLTYTMRSTGDYMNEQKDRAELLIKNYG